MILFEVCLIVGFLAVASNPSPYFAALGLVVAAGVGCLLLVSKGVTFLCLVLFLVYLGGMMVVFAYSAALVADPYPEAWGGEEVKLYLGIYSVVLGLWIFVGGKLGGVEEKHGLEVQMEDWLGVSMMFSSGGMLLLLVGWALLLTLFGVLEVVRGHYGGTLRAV
uniref:NADH dehydrogenase subunit 6 n=1 Tax=Phyllomedusa bahiana TaxID=860369 RepID=UPI00220E2CD0|nr:NADH dehydrogenase subunit 6 [Phyllomedusa bahiana]UXL87089.1 NADH dehydrogenase subunit 6 [Phyllomedusa bahiana]